MPIALVNSVTFASSGGNGGTTSGMDMTGASLLVAVTSDQATPVITDSSGNTWASAVVGSGVSPNVRCFYVANPTVTASMTFTVTDTAGYPAVVYLGFSGVATVSPLDQTNNFNIGGGGTSIAAGSITPGSAGEVVVAGVANNDQSGVPTIGSGFSTPVTVGAAGGVSFGVAASYLVQTTATAVNPTWTDANGNLTGATIASFIAGAGGSTGTGTGAITFAGAGVANVSQTVSPYVTIRAAQFRVGQRGPQFMPVPTYGLAQATNIILGAGSGNLDFEGSGVGTVTSTGTGAGNLDFEGSGTATVTVSTTGTGAIVFAGAGSAGGITTATGTGAIVFAGSGTGSVTSTAAGTGAIVFAGAGTPTVISAATGTGAITFAGSGTASIAGAIVGTGAIAFNGGGVATVTSVGVGAGPIVFAGAGLAKVGVSTAGSGAIVFAGSGAATAFMVGAGTGTITFNGAGTAIYGFFINGVGTGAIVFNAAGTATAVVLPFTVGSLTAAAQDAQAQLTASAARTGGPT